VIDTAVADCMTWMKVWPIVSVTSLPFLSKNCVGPVTDGFFQVPRIVRPLVEIHALPEPTTSASSQCLSGWPSLSGPKCMTITTTFLGAIRSPFAASSCLPSTLTERRYVFDARS